MNKKTNKIIILLSVILIFVYLSCVQDLIVGSVWEGTFDSGTNKGGVKFYFSPNDEIDGFVEIIGGSVNGTYVNLSGDYKISSSDTFIADLTGSAEISGDAVNEYFQLELDGVLNYMTGIAAGEYIIEINFSDGTNFKEKGDFELQQVK